VSRTEAMLGRAFSRIEALSVFTPVLVALFLAVRHSQLVRDVILAEPPAVSLLTHLTGPEAKSGMDSFHDIQRRMVEPMQQAFRRGDRNASVAISMDYVFNDPHAWEKMGESLRQERSHNAHEWNVMTTSGTLFPEIRPRKIEKITVPTRLLSGAKSYPFLALISEDLARLLPKRQNIVLPDAGPQMWDQKPEPCRRDAENFPVKAGAH
jgi:pimeloyl-ACP methyl ester carboxylesterase